MASISRYSDYPGGLFGLQRLNRLLDEAFVGSAFPEQGSAITSAWFAPTDVSEDANSLQITLEVPGVRPEARRITPVRARPPRVPPKRGKRPAAASAA